jgi:hypothetical protein
MSSSVSTNSPTELPQVRQPLATLQLPPVGSSEGMLRRRAAFPLTSVEDDPHIVPVIKLATQLLVPIQTLRATTKISMTAQCYSDTLRRIITLSVHVSTSGKAWPHNPLAVNRFSDWSLHPSQGARPSIGGAVSTVCRGFLQ